MSVKLPAAVSVKTVAFALMSLTLPVWLSACGGGGDSGSNAIIIPPLPPQPPMPPGPPPEGIDDPVWTEGVYESAHLFKDRCQAPRPGHDAEGNLVGDVRGSALLERFWLRSWTRETYLWNTEVTDRNPAAFSDRRSYFDVLRTYALTPSGKYKDDFHFSEPTTDYIERKYAAPYATYGETLVAYSTVPPRDFRVRYTEPFSPASEINDGRRNLERGARILAINGMDLVNSNDVNEIHLLNEALFPRAAGLTNVFTVEYTDGMTRDVMMTSENLSPRPVNRTAILPTQNGPVGYILFNTFSPYVSEAQLVETMEDMAEAQIQDLVLDLRYNGGGLLAVASQLSYMVAGSGATQGQIFEEMRFNASAGNRNPATGEVNRPVPFYDETLGFSLPEGQELPSLGLSRVFILSTEETCSASEAVINGLRGVGVDVILIGDTTCGKPYGFYPTDNCDETYYTIQFQGVNALGFGDYADGFIPQTSLETYGVRTPGCQVADDLSHELGDPQEALLSAALGYRVTGGGCPTVTPMANMSMRMSNTSSRDRSGGMAITLPEPSIMDVNRDMRMPSGRK